MPPVRTTNKWLERRYGAQCRGLSTGLWIGTGDRLGRCRLGVRLRELGRPWSPAGTCAGGKRGERWGIYKRRWRRRGDTWGVAGTLGGGGVVCRAARGASGVHVEFSIGHWISNLQSGWNTGGPGGTWGVAGTL